MNHIKRFLEICEKDGFQSAIQSTKRFITITKNKKLKNVNWKYRVAKWEWQKYKQKMQYKEAAPDPYELIYINPKMINWLLVPRFLNSKYKFSNFCGGDWDRSYTDLELHYIDGKEDIINDKPKLINIGNWTFYTSLKHHFVNNIPWKETEIFNVFMTQDISSRYDSEDSIRSRLEELDRLFYNMKNSGYLTQEQIQPEDNNPFSADKPPSRPELSEVWVHIGRDGEIIFCTGRHRFSVARILELDRIPVRVHIRHKNWQEIREQISKGKIPSQIDLNHPDLQDIHLEAV